jgi:hypothetical protein
MLTIVMFLFPVGLLLGAVSLERLERPMSAADLSD